MYTMAFNWINIHRDPFKKSENRDYNIPNATEYTKCVACSTFSRNKYVLNNIFSKNLTTIHFRTSFKQTMIFRQ